MRFRATPLGLSAGPERSAGRGGPQPLPHRLLPERGFRGPRAVPSEGLRPFVSGSQSGISGWGARYKCRFSGPGLGGNLCLRASPEDADAVGFETLTQAEVAQVCP